MGRLCDFAAIQAAAFVPPRQTLVQQQKMTGAVTNSDLITADQDNECNVVEEKKTRGDDKGDYRRRNN